jgi:nucleoid DNA-binding protein
VRTATKQPLIEAVSAKTDRAKSAVESILEAVLETIAERNWSMAKE